MFPDGEVGAAIDQLVAQGSGFVSYDYDAHGRVLRFSTDDRCLAALAHEICRAFPAALDSARPDARLCLTASAEWSIPPATEDLRGHAVLGDATAARVAFSRRAGVNYFALAPLGAVAYELETAQALGFVTAPASHRPWLVSHYFIQSMVLELLRGLGLYWVHGASVAADGRAALLVGESGSGKTTTALRLVEAGFSLLSEDHTLLSPERDRLGLLGFVADVAVTDETVAMLPWLRDRLPEQPWGRKLRIEPQALLAGRMVQSAAPGVVLFLRVAGAERSRVEPVSPAEALRRLLPNSLLASQPEVATRHLDALTRLASMSRCYDLRLGRDIASLPALIGELLTAGAAGVPSTA